MTAIFHCRLYPVRENELHFCLMLSALISILCGITILTTPSPPCMLLSNMTFDHPFYFPRHFVRCVFFVFVRNIELTFDFDPNRGCALTGGASLCPFVITDTFTHLCITLPYVSFILLLPFSTAWPMYYVLFDVKF